MKQYAFFNSFPAPWNHQNVIQILWKFYVLGASLAAEGNVNPVGKSLNCVEGRAKVNKMGQNGAVQVFWGVDFPPSNQGLKDKMSHSFKVVKALRHCDSSQYN